jgi:DNA repair photolyase
MMGPIIPSFNDHEILNVAKNTARLGAKKMVNTIISLNGQTGEIFTEWLNKTMPDRATRILNQIKACHQGKLNDSRLGVRKKGEGKYAENIHQQIQLAKKMYFKEEMPPLSTQHFIHYTQQLKLDF